MTASDVDRLYTAVEALRSEVHGYRKDLNGRLRTLEMANAEREGADEQKSTTVRIVFGVAGMAAAISAITAFILDQLP
jgi:hypothetical protein